MSDAFKAIRKQSLYISLSALVLIQVFLLLFNGETYGGADNINHYQIARYAFRYPELFLDLWGKPVYTTLLAPFTFLGYKVAKGFNLLLAIISLILIYNLSWKIFKRKSIVILLLVAFSPVYFFLMITCLTEVLFGLALIVAVYLFIENKLIFSAIVISFVPFIRSEGIVLFPVFMLAFLLKRSYISILLMTVGTVFYTLIGLFVFDDIWWILHKFPYPIGQSVYGSGSLFHFLKNSNFIFGVPFLVLLVLGLFYWLYEIVRNLSLKDENLVRFIVIVGSWTAYFVAHSYLWWKGTGGSLGLTRVIGAVIPMAGLTAMKGVQLIAEKIKNRKIFTIIISFVVFAQVFSLFHHYDFPTKSSPIDKLIAKSVDYLKQESFSGKVFYFNPEFVFYLGIDPYDQSRCNWGIGDKLNPSNSMDYGDIIIWDAHFGPNEGGVSLEAIEKDSSLQKIKSFLPVEEVKVLGGYDYSIQIFKKVLNKNGFNINKKTRISKVLSFEDYLVSEIVTVDGSKVWEMNNDEFSPNIVFSPKEILRNEIFEFKVFLQYKITSQLKEDEILLVFSISDGRTSLRYEKKDLISSKDIKSWQAVEMNIKIPASIPESSKVEVYVWNKGKKHLFLKELIVNVSSY